MKGPDLVADPWLGSHGVLLGPGASFSVGSRKCRLQFRRVLAEVCWPEPAVCDLSAGDVGCLPGDNISNCCDNFKLGVGCRRRETFWRARGSLPGGRYCCRHPPWPLRGCSHGAPHTPRARVWGRDPHHLPPGTKPTPPSPLKARPLPSAHWVSLGPAVLAAPCRA